MEKSTEYILVVNKASPYAMESIRQLRDQPAFTHLRALVLTAEPHKYGPLATGSSPVEVVACSFESDAEIVAALEPFKDQIRAVICRGDKHIQYLRKVIPHLPPDVLTATPEALEAATDKRLMREAFLRHAPEITPHFTRVHDASVEAIQAVETALQYPVIVKPANLASSMLIQSCANREELQTALASVFKVIDKIYSRQGYIGEPQVIVEEYLEGDFYSVDAYIMEPGRVYYCPPVGYVPAKQLGIDDFFLYKRFVPTELSEEETAAGNETVAKALAAVGLTHSSAHVELVLTKHGWKIIELGPRLGRFRHLMYKAAYGIDHSMNDLLIHVGKEPVIPTKLINHCSAYSIYPEKEGTLREIRGQELIEGNPMIRFLRVLAKPGDPCVHAKNGGTVLAEFIMADPDPVAFRRMVQEVEQNVKAVVE